MKRVDVITRPRTMSGRPGGLRLHLPRPEAEDWIARGWADPAPTDAEDGETGRTKPTKRGDTSGTARERATART